MPEIISKDEYVFAYLKAYVNRKNSEEFSLSVLDDLIKQWKFDYQMEKEFRPGRLMK